MSSCNQPITNRGVSIKSTNLVDLIVIRKKRMDYTKQNVVRNFIDITMPVPRLLISPL
jgi:hypothetical protein